MELDPYSHEFHENPWPVYEWLREEAPVYRNEALGFWALSRHDDVAEASRDWETYSSAKGTVLEHMVDEWDPIRRITPMMINMDPPQHTRLRKLVSRVFTPRAVADLEPVIRQHAVRFLDPLVDLEEFDLIEDFAGRIPIQIICEILGIPEEDQAQVREWTALTLARGEDTTVVPPEAMEAGIEWSIYMDRLAKEKFRDPGEDMLSGLVRTEVEEEGEITKLSSGEIVGFAQLLSGAGNETVTRLLGNIMSVLPGHPEALQTLLGDRRRIPDAVEEGLRLMPPSPIQGRLTTRSVTLHGATIPSGARVLLLTAAATRDPREFENADRFDIDRPPHISLGFGYGIHSCLGASLARLECRVCLEELLDRFPSWEVDLDRSERIHTSNVQGFTRLPLRPAKVSA